MKSEKPNPYNKRETKNDKKGFERTEAGVKPVAKDTNKTRRKETRERIVGVTEKQSTPRSNLKKDMKKSMKGKC